MTIRVLIVDDSASMRALLQSQLSREADIEVVASAASAAEARELIRTLDPDVVTLDVEMPQMNGLDFLEKIMRLRPTPVIIVSGITQDGTDAAARALALGAIDCYAKSDQPGGLPANDNGRLAQLIRQAAQVKFMPQWRQSTHRPAPPVQSRRANLIAIGASTGGVEALQLVLRDFPEDCPPTLIVQHLNANFTDAVAKRLDANCRAKVVVADTDLPLRSGHVYFAPGGDRHLAVSGSETLHTKLRRDDLVSGHRPSVDVLFHSVARCAGANAIGILLTGMGKDGAEGLLAMAQAGAFTIAQDEATCTVFGMPKAAIALGAAKVVAPIDRIATHALDEVA